VFDLLFPTALHACLLMIAVLATAWFAWPSGRTWVRRAWAIGWIVGAAAWAIGYFGPAFWDPDADQAWLLGVLVTGPLGFALASASVLVVGVVRSRRGAAAA
jgi:hypothetical protein